MRWFRAPPKARIYTTSISHAELWCGVELLPAGCRRRELSEGIRQLIADLFKGCILPFTDAEAVADARIFAQRQAIGRPVGAMDARIAAIALVHGARLATRNTADFEHCGIQLINPWVD